MSVISTPSPITLLKEELRKHGRRLRFNPFSKRLMVTFIIFDESENDTVEGDYCTYRQRVKRIGDTEFYYTSKGELCCMDTSDDSIVALHMPIYDLTRAQIDHILRALLI